MTKQPKCKYCHKPLKVDDSVFIRIARYDSFGRRVKKQAFCLNCWDHTTHFTHSVKVTHDDIKKLDNTDSFDDHNCGNCTHLIFKNYKNCSGTCFYTHRIKSFYDRCEHEEEMS